MARKLQLIYALPFGTSAVALGLLAVSWYRQSPDLLLPAALLPPAGVILFLAACWRQSRWVRLRFAMLQQELQQCDRLRNPITLSRSGGDEIDGVITRIRDYIRGPQEQLQSARAAAGDYLAARDEVQEAAQQYDTGLAALSALTTGLKGRTSALDQLLRNSEESLKILELKTSRLQDQGENQAVQVTQTTTAIEEIHASVRSITERAETRRSSAISLCEAARQDELYIRQTRKDIQTIADEITGVSEILAAINAISEQTSQLSLNAFIESAHGGENNKGFEVVATEIRQLADSSAENADSIRTLLHRIDDRIREAQFFSEKTMHTFQTSVQVINEFSQSMEAISGHMEFTSTTSSGMVEEAQQLSARAEEIQNLNRLTAELVDRGRSRLQQTRERAGGLETFTARTDENLRKPAGRVSRSDQASELRQRLGLE